jgi:signal transduction histidine kinase
VHDSALLADQRRPGAAPIPVILVEDNEHMADALQLALAQNGFEVTHCVDAKQALDQLRSGSKPSVIVLDLWTPNMDGWEFRLEQRREPAWSSIPVVAISADRSSQAAAIDVDAFLPKPVEEGTLIKAIRAVLAKTGRSAALAKPRQTIDLGNALYVLSESLGGALGHCEALIKEDISGIAEARARAMGMQLRSAQRAAGHMEEVMLGPDAPESNLPFGMVDVGRVLRQSLIHVELELPDETVITSDVVPQPIAEADPVKLGQLLVNLLRNAGEAMVDSARPSLQLEVWPESDETLALLISDSGCGMPPDVLNHAFDPFYSFGRRRIAQGLGLTVARRLAREMGGTLELLSSVEHGSMARLCLRRAKPCQTRELAHPAQQVEHVLVVAEDAHMLTQLRDALSARFAVTAMRSWQALAHVYGGQTFDMILCDNTRSETRALPFFAALAMKYPEQATRVVFLQNAAVEHKVRRWLEDTGIWQVEGSLIEGGLPRRLERLLQLWASLGMRPPQGICAPDEA